MSDYATCIVVKKLSSDITHFLILLVCYVGFAC